MADTQLVIGAISGSLLFIGLWQIEMMWLHRQWELPGFVLPFGKTVPWWFARDIWYACIIAGYLLLLFSR